jgi:15-cis-phytoene synthase
LHEAERSVTVRDIARSGDPDRALAAVFAPRGARSDLLALCAFNVELARIAGQVNEPELGAMRLQWWREAIERGRNGEPVGHPVADALGATLQRRALSGDRIDRLIDARQFDVAGKPMPGWRTFATYLEDTAGAMFILAAECLDAPGSDLDHAASKSGLAYGLTGLMRALPVHAARGRVYLPQDMLRSYGTTPEALLAGSASEGLRHLLSALREKARTACEEARDLAGHLSPASRAAFLPLSLIGPYLAALERLDQNGEDPLRVIADINPLYRFWRMTSWRG